MRLPAILCMALMLCGASASAQDNEPANRLVVEVVQLLRAAEAIPADRPDDRLQLLESAIAALDRIVTGYPGSDAAVRLATGQSIGSLSREVVQRHVDEARVAICIPLPTSSCVLGMAQTAARDIADPRSRARALRVLGVALARAGRSGPADQLFEQAKQVAETVADPRIRGGELREVATALARAGRLDQAEQVALSIVDSMYRAVASYEVAIALARAGQNTQADLLFRQAEQAARMMVNPTAVADIQGQVAVALAVAGRFNQALRVVNAIDDAGWRGAALQRVGPVFAQAGRFEQALQIAATFVNPGSAEWRVGVALAQAGRVDQALQLATAHADPWGRAVMFGAIAAAAARAGDQQRADALFAQALQITATFDEFSGNGARGRISLALIEAGRLDQASQVATTLAADFRQSVRRALVDGLLRAARFAVAMDLAFNEPDPKEQVLLSSSVAVALARAGEYLYASGFFNLALQRSAAMADPLDRVEALTTIAEALEPLRR